MSKRALSQKDIKGLGRDDLREIIDHTLLRQEADLDEYGRFIESAKEYGFGSVFVPPCFVSWAVDELAGETVVVGTPVGFPFGYSRTEVKVLEALAALGDGARELDVVMNVSLALSGEWKTVQEDLAAVVDAVRRWEKEQGNGGILVKTILETPYLRDDQIREACGVAESAGMDFVKTATGLGAGGATVGAVEVMRDSVGDRLGVKAAGGIRTWADVRAMLGAGASRVGTSTGPQIMEDFVRARG